MYIFPICKKKTAISVVLGLLFAVQAWGQALNARFLNYIDQYKDVAMEQCRIYGVPASITLAQGLLESNAGASYLATRGNNHFGIKCHKWAGEAVEYDDTLKHDCYRKYGAAVDSYTDHSKFLCGKRYQPLHQLDTIDYRGWAAGLRQYGYAEDPAYPQKLIALIEQYNLNQYDSLAMIPAHKVKPLKQNKEKEKEKEKKKKEEVPAPAKKNKKQPASIPPPKNHKEKLEDGRDAKEKVKPNAIEEKKAATEEKKKPAPEAKRPAPEPEKRMVSPAKRRQHNPRTAPDGKPLSGNADNDD